MTEELTAKLGPELAAELLETYATKYAPKVARVYPAIVKVMAAMARDGIGKDRKNEQQGFKFRGIDDVYNALSRELSNASLVVLPRVLSRIVTEKTTQAGKTLFYVALQVEFDMVSAEDGSRHTIVTFGEAMDSGDKATNKAMSAAYKYAMFQAFCIPTEGDNDADATTHAVKAPVSPSADKTERGRSTTPAPTPFTVEDGLAAIAAVSSLEMLQSLKMGLAKLSEDPRIAEIQDAFRAKAKSFK